MKGRRDHISSSPSLYFKNSVMCHFEFFSVFQGIKIAVAKYTFSPMLEATVTVVNGPMTLQILPLHMMESLVKVTSGSEHVPHSPRHSTCPVKAAQGVCGQFGAVIGKERRRCDQQLQRMPNPKLFLGLICLPRSMGTCTSD